MLALLGGCSVPQSNSSHGKIVWPFGALCGLERLHPQLTKSGEVC